MLASIFMIFVLSWGATLGFGVTSSLKVSSPMGLRSHFRFPQLLFSPP